MDAHEKFSFKKWIPNRNYCVIISLVDSFSDEFAINLHILKTLGEFYKQQDHDLCSLLNTSIEGSFAFEPFSPLTDANEKYVKQAINIVSRFLSGGEKRIVIDHTSHGHQYNLNRFRRRIIHYLCDEPRFGIKYEKSVVKETQHGSRTRCNGGKCTGQKYTKDKWNKYFTDCHRYDCSDKHGLCWYQYDDGDDGDICEEYSIPDEVNCKLCDNHYYIRNFRNVKVTLTKI